MDDSEIDTGQCNSFSFLSCRLKILAVKWETVFQVRHSLVIIKRFEELLALSQLAKSLKTCAKITQKLSSM